MSALYGSAIGSLEPGWHCDRVDDPDGRSELPRLMRMPRVDDGHDRPRTAEHVVVRLSDQVDSQTWRILGADGAEMWARRAASCMVSPHGGDLVQLLMCGTSAWITAVLELSSDRGGRVELNLGESDVTLCAGSVEIRANRSIRQVATELNSVSAVVREVTDERSSHIRQASITKAGSIAIEADQHVRVHSKLATVVADALLKLDGAQIHMG